MASHSNKLTRSKLSSNGDQVIGPTSNKKFRGDTDVDNLDPESTKQLDHDQSVEVDIKSGIKKAKGSLS